MKRSLLLLVIGFSLMITPVLTQAQPPTGVSVTCDDGSSFDNGVEVSVNQLRAGYTYTATAVGLNGFDPVLAVLDPRTGTGLCNDDNAAAGRYAAYLPTTGTVAPSSTSAQVNFSQTSGSALANVSLVVGGYSGQGGEFLLIFEGMSVTSADNAGDSFSVNITPGMVDSGSALTMYMITRAQSQVDPYIYQSDSNLNPIKDSQGNPIACDDAGSQGLCQPNSVDLSNYSITLGSNALTGWQYDAMLSVPLAGTQLNNDPSLNYLNFVMTSSPTAATEGQYLLVFDITTGTSGGSTSNGGLTGGQQETGGTQNQTAPTAVPRSNNAGTPSGMSVTCTDGSSFDNGVEVIISQMRSGYNYTATAVGLNGFDPVLAVLDTNSHRGLCNDDDPAATFYKANLPTTGNVPASNLSAQVTFSQGSGNTFADISLVVGGYNNQSGEFLLILEGMASTPGDGAGDVFSVNLTPGMVASGVPLTVYMITRGQSNLDPYIYQANSSLTPLADSQGNLIACDDAGTQGLCQPGSVDLSSSSVTIGAGKLTGWSYDAMLTLPLTGLRLNTDSSQNYYTFVMTSSPQQSTQGQYLLVFHIGETA
ncbi:MAG: hypothetical protein GC204_15345 [Chloroflexi bacterium]|nr:hypothetical protein [Chloroflexota bacterium]